MEPYFNYIIFDAFLQRFEKMAPWKCIYDRMAPLCWLYTQNIHHPPLYQ